MGPLAPPLPTFLIIGAQKSATRWLRLNLGLHPAVFTASRELEFFNNGPRYRDEGTDWYRAQFEGWAGEAIVGEATPGYMFWRHRPAVVSERIEETLPDVRLIATLRNPIDRAQSAMVHHIEYGALPRDSVLVDLVKTTPPEKDRLGIIAGGWYAASLEPYLQQKASSEPGRRSLTLAERRELWEYFAADVAQLEQLTGRDLSFWNPS
jgi:Sulfotransferase domain